MTRLNATGRDAVTVYISAKDRSVSDARAYVEAMLGFEVYSHHLYQALRAPAHADAEKETTP